MSSESKAREVLLVAHTGRAEIVSTARRVARILGRAGIGLRVLSQEVASTKMDGSGNESSGTLDPEILGANEIQLKIVDWGPEAALGAEIVLVLGGDGTFLRAAELARWAAVPVLGINLGHIGFLAETEAEHLDEALGQVIRREYRVEHRMTLDIAVRIDDKVIGVGWALNEASIEKGPHLGVLEVIVEVDGRPVSAFGCDGVLIATPTGSTAYAFSAGGPVLWPELEALLVVPSNAHALFARPLVTSPMSIVAVEIESARKDAMVFCDGQRPMEVPAGARIEVVRGQNPVRWVRLDSAPFADRLVRKFHLPVKGWRGRTR